MWGGGRVGVMGRGFESVCGGGGRGCESGCDGERV